MALVTFYIVEDLVLQQQSSNALAKVGEFLLKLENKKLITSRDRSMVNSILFLFSPAESVNVSDSVVTSDAILLRDILLYNDPIVVLNRSCMFYYGEPMKAKFKFLKEDVNSLTPELFFDKCFITSQRIHNTFIKQLFIENYFNLMEVQGKSRIFPF